MKDKSDLAKGWFAKAESDLVSAHHILAGPGPYDTVCFHHTTGNPSMTALFLRLLHTDDKAAALIEAMAALREGCSINRPGLTWPLRAARFGPVVLPSGSIFSVRGYAILASSNDLEVVGGLTNSAAFDFLFKVMLGRFGFPEFIVGVLQQLPIPSLNGYQGTKLSEIWVDCVNLKRNLDRTNETSHVFHLPALLQVQGRTFTERIANWQAKEAEAERKLAEYQRQIDDRAFQLYH